MTEFQDGPAQGHHLLLKRAPLYLRVVSGSGDWDALDQLADTPDDQETIYAYERVGKAGNCHLRYGGRDRHLSGFYVMASYRLVSEQPSDAEMRDTAAWRAWCRMQVGFPTTQEQS